MKIVIIFVLLCSLAGAAQLETSTPILPKATYPVGRHNFTTQLITGTRLTIREDRTSLTDTTAVYNVVVEATRDQVIWRLVCSSVGIKGGVIATPVATECTLPPQTTHIRGWVQVSKGSVTVGVALITE